MNALADVLINMKSTITPNSKIWLTCPILSTFYQTFFYDVTFTNAAWNG